MGEVGEEAGLLERREVRCDAALGWICGARDDDEEDRDGDEERRGGSGGSGYSAAAGG